MQLPTKQTSADCLVRKYSLNQAQAHILSSGERAIQLSSSGNIKSRRKSFVETASNAATTTTIMASKTTTTPTNANNIVVAMSSVSSWSTSTGSQHQVTSTSALNGAVVTAATAVPEALTTTTSPFASGVSSHQSGSSLGAAVLAENRSNRTNNKKSPRLFKNPNHVNNHTVSTNTNSNNNNIQNSDTDYWDVPLPVASGSNINNDDYIKNNSSLTKGIFKFITLVKDWCQIKWVGKFIKYSY